MELSQRISKGIVGNRLQKSFGVISELLQKRRIRNLSTRKQQFNKVFDTLWQENFVSKMFGVISLGTD